MTTPSIKRITVLYCSILNNTVVTVVFLFVTAVYNWRGETRYGLPLEIGETVQILEECAGIIPSFFHESSIKFIDCKLKVPSFRKYDNCSTILGEAYHC